MWNTYLLRSRGFILQKSYGCAPRTHVFVGSLPRETGRCPPPQAIATRNSNIKNGIPFKFKYRNRKSANNSNWGENPRAYKKLYPKTDRNVSPRLHLCYNITYAMSLLLLCKVCDEFSCLIFLGDVSSVSGQLYKPFQPVRLSTCYSTSIKIYNCKCILDHTEGKISKYSGV